MTAPGANRGQGFVTARTGTTGTTGGGGVEGGGVEGGGVVGGGVEGGGVEGGSPPVGAAPWSQAQIGTIAKTATATTLFQFIIDRMLSITEPPTELFKN
ncbi:MAG: hypothetical protein NTAFB01_08220 [Nitrospira sp.]